MIPGCNRFPQSLVKLLMVLGIVSLGRSSADIVPLKGGMILDGSLTTNSPANVLLDIGLRIPEGGTIDNPIIFESGNAGFGFVLALIGDEVVAFQDREIPLLKATKVPVKNLEGHVVSIRLDLNYGKEHEYLSLSVEGHTRTVKGSSLIGIPSDDPRISEGGGTGVGGLVGSIAGQIRGATEVIGLFDESKAIDDDGPNVLGPLDLVGTLFTGKDADDRRSISKPLPSFYIFGETEPVAFNLTATIKPGRGLELKWKNSYGFQDKVQYSTDLKTWHDDLRDSIISRYGHLAEVSYLDRWGSVWGEPKTRRYYRIVRTRITIP